MYVHVCMHVCMYACVCVVVAGPSCSFVQKTICCMCVCVCVCVPCARTTVGCAVEALWHVQAKPPPSKKAASVPEKQTRKRKEPTVRWTFILRYPCVTLYFFILQDSARAADAIAHDPPNTEPYEFVPVSNYHSTQCAMYVCMYACMYAIYVCNVCMYVCMYVCNICMQCMYAMYVCVYACMYACMYVCMYVHPKRSL